MKGTIRTICTATACHPTYLQEAECDMGSHEFEDFKAESERQLLPGELVFCSEPDEAGDHLSIEDRHGDELWVERRFIQWEGQS